MPAPVVKRARAIMAGLGIGLVVAGVRVGESAGGWWVYLLVCHDGSYYTGVTTDLSRRVGEHLSGRGARYTRTRRPVTLVAAAACGSRSEATRWEARLKAGHRKAKEGFARKHPVPVGWEPPSGGDRGLGTGTGDAGEADAI